MPLCGGEDKNPDGEMILAVTSFPAGGDAPAFAKSLVEARLAACVHLLPAGRSFYRWEGRLHDDPESLLLIKTPKRLFTALEDFLKANHPYEVPELFAIGADHVSAAYLSWVLRETADPAPSESEPAVS